MKVKPVGQGMASQGAKQKVSKTVEKIYNLGVHTIGNEKRSASLKGHAVQKLKGSDLPPITIKTS